MIFNVTMTGRVGLDQGLGSTTYDECSKTLPCDETQPHTWHSNDDDGDDDGVDDDGNGDDDGDDDDGNGDDNGDDDEQNASL